ncbi:MAG: hypothetical protein ACRDNZ_16675 [Streptosporangiaceae bacterium]
MRSATTGPWCGGVVLGRLASQPTKHGVDELRMVRYVERHHANETMTGPCGPVVSYVSGGNFGIERG